MNVSSSHSEFNQNIRNQTRTNHRGIVHVWYREPPLGASHCIGADFCSTVHGLPTPSNRGATGNRGVISVRAPVIPSNPAGRASLIFLGGPVGALCKKKKGSTTFLSSSAAQLSLHIVTVRRHYGNRARSRCVAGAPIWMREGDSSSSNN